MRRALTAIIASCSEVVPYVWKWRWAFSASQLAAEYARNGMFHWNWPPSLVEPPPPPMPRPAHADALAAPRTLLGALRDRAVHEDVAGQPRADREDGVLHRRELGRPFDPTRVPAQLQAQGLVHLG